MTSEADEQEINDIIFAASSDDGLELDQEKLKKKKKKKKRKSEKLKRKKSKRTGPDGYSEDGSFFGNVEEVESPAAKSSPGTRSSPGERSSPDTEAYERVGGGVSHTHSQGLLKLASTHVPNLSDMIGDDDGGAFEPDYGESSFEQRPSMMQVLKTREKARRTSVGSSDDAQMLASRPQFPESRNKSSRSLGRTSVQSMEQEKMKEIQERGAVFGPPSRFDGGSQNRSSRSLGRASAISMEHEKQREARYSSGSRSTDGDGTAHVGAHPVSGPAPVTTKRSPKPSYSPPGGSHNSRVGAVPMVGGRGQSKTGDDRVGAIPTSSRSGAGTAIAPSHDDDRVGAVAVSAPPRPTKTIDDRVGAVAVAGTGRTKGPSVAAGADSYDRENSRAQRAAETDRDAKMKSNLNRLSYLPSAEDYEQAGRRTSFTEKSRVSVMPAAESYGDGKEGEETTPPDPKGKSRGPSTASYAAADMPSKDRTGPAHFSTNETYDAHDHGTLPPGNRREAPGTLSRSSSVRPSSRETSARSLSEPQQVPAGAFFITGAGNVVSRQPGALTNPPALADHLVNENAAVRASNRTLPVQDAEPEDIEEVNEQYSGHHDLEKPQAWYCSCWFKVLFVVVVLGAVGGGVGAALSSGGGGGSGSEGGSEPAGPPPTPAPTIFADVARRDAVQTVIVDAGLTSAEDLNNSTSPQNAAWVWIVNIDRLSPTESPTLSEEAVTLEKILVRYALATFFYATNGELWLSSGNWLSGRQDECNWEYLTCGDNGRVIAFETPEGAGTNIAGNIPSEIKVLTTLGEFCESTSVFYFLLSLTFCCGQSQSFLATMVLLASIMTLVLSLRCVRNDDATDKTSQEPLTFLVFNRNARASTKLLTRTFPVVHFGIDWARVH